MTTGIAARTRVAHFELVAMPRLRERCVTRTGGISAGAVSPHRVRTSAAILTAAMPISRNSPPGTSLRSAGRSTRIASRLGLGTLMPSTGGPTSACTAGETRHSPLNDNLSSIWRLPRRRQEAHENRVASETGERRTRIAAAWLAAPEVYQVADSVPRPMARCNLPTGTRYRGPGKITRGSDISVPDRGSNRKNTACGGYQHAVVGRHRFNFSPASNPDARQSLPDIIMCNGPAYRNQPADLGLVKNFP